MAARRKAQTTTEEPAVKQCECGCGGVVIRPTARFITGHDGRRKGQLLKAARAGDEEAAAELDRLGWGKFNKPTKAMLAKQAREAAREGGK